MSSVTNKVNILIPVAPFEPEEIIRKSVQSIKNVEVPENIEKEIFYIIDTDQDPEEDERITFLRNETSENVKTIVRTSNEGRRAGALNRGLEELEEPGYVAIFDIDSRPEKNFIKACVEQLESSPEVFMSTCPREILNADQNFVTKLVSSEYDFLMSMQLLLQKTGGFNHFNGLISVLDGEYIKNKGLNEERMCEDTDFTQRAYLDGRRPAINNNSVVGEQAMTSFSDLYSQKVRWMNGAIEGLKYFSRPMLSGDLSLKTKASWFSAMTMPFFSAILSPLVVFYVVSKILTQGNIIEPISKGVYLFIFAWFISFCGVVNIVRLFTGRNIRWKDSEREIL